MMNSQRFGMKRKELLFILCFSIEVNVYEFRRNLIIFRQKSKMWVNDE